MNPERIEAQLAPAPAAVRLVMLEDMENLAPGAAAVVGRFFSTMVACGDPPNLPRSETFRAAARSESTFRLLLRTLSRYAPQVCNADAIEVSQEWYARRGSPRANRTPPQDGTNSNSNRHESWPAEWQACLPGLETAPIKAATLARYKTSLDRCAAIVNAGAASPGLGFVTASELVEHLVNHPDPKRRVKPVTAAGYIFALVALGRHGGAPDASVRAASLVVQELKERAAMLPNAKDPRIAALMERGGFAFIGSRIGEIRAETAKLPPHSAAWRRGMQMALVCALIMNKPPRRSDMVGWRIGHEIVREIDGTWRSEWTQQKTGYTTEAGTLWPEVCEILDDWILCGRPTRLISHRYQKLKGRFLLTLENRPAHKRLPSTLTNLAIGIPSHDLRTLAADYLRRHDPARAAGIISTHLGHATAKAGDAYRSACEQDLAGRLWQEDREAIAQVGPQGPHPEPGQW